MAPIPRPKAMASARPIPVKWTDAQFKWKTPLPATGHGSPCLGRQVFLLRDEETGARSAVAVHAHSGKTCGRSITPPNIIAHKENSFASSTPAADPIACILLTQESVLTAVPRRQTTLAKRPRPRQRRPRLAPPLCTAISDMLTMTMTATLPHCRPGWTGKIAGQTPRKSKRLTYSTPIPYKASGRDEELIFTN